MRIRTFVLLAALAAIGAAVIGSHGTAGGVTAAHEYNHFVLRAVLDGGQEIGNDGQRAAGSDGFGSFSAVLSRGKLCYGLQVSGTGKPIAAHIHRGKAGVSGPIVVSLGTPARGARGASFSAGCVSPPAKVVDALKSGPRRFYVNVHTGKFQSGAVRGQLAHP